MTSEQLLELRSMTAVEIVKKYFPLFLRGAINQQTYEFVLRQGQADDQDIYQQRIDSTPVQQGYRSSHSVGTTSSYDHSSATFHPEHLIGLSQKERLLNVLGDKQWHSTVELMQLAYGMEDKKGICRIGARVYDLKSDGHAIESRKLNKGVWEYRLV